eukprot:3641491-Pyramimonas_sp.AAC.1
MRPGVVVQSTTRKQPARGAATDEGRPCPTGCRWSAGRKSVLHRQRVKTGSSHTRCADVRMAEGRA